MVLLLAIGLTPCPVHSGPPLFESNSLMDISLPVDFSSLCRPREDNECDFSPTEMCYTEAGGETRTIPVEIKVRGGWRSLTRNCSAPLLWVRFDQEQAVGTPFEDQGLLPLTTHCGTGLSLESMSARTNRTDWEQYLLKEYLGHRLYTELTDMSIRARLMTITYPNPEQKGRAIRNYAFFTEHFDSVAERNHAERLPRPGFDHESLDVRSADILALFQFMIGNTDWSVTRERNIVLMRTESESQSPVPYDLDMSGLVNAPYAGPAPGLPIDGVTDRYYLGFCHPDIDWDELFEYFTSRRDSLLALVDEVPGLGRNSARQTRSYLEKFFEILGDENERNEQIVESCQPWPPSSIDHTTPPEKR